MSIVSSFFTRFFQFLLSRLFLDFISTYLQVSLMISLYRARLKAIWRVLNGKRPIGILWHFYFQSKPELFPVISLWCIDLFWFFRQPCNSYFEWPPILWICWYDKNFVCISEGRTNSTTLYVYFIWAFEFQNRGNFLLFVISRAKGC
jgi:hypothetical protein